MISLVDEVRQWFKSSVGVKLKGTAREVAFCSHAILQSGPFIVKDTLKDPRFVDNALVTGKPHIRFTQAFLWSTSRGWPWERSVWLTVSRASFRLRSKKRSKPCHGKSWRCWS